jgi:hypothetical protein
MITKQIDGVPFEVESPSFYRLAGFPIDVSYLGDRWYLQCPGENGQPRYEPFNHLADAAAFIKSAWAKVGLPC